MEKFEPTVCIICLKVKRHENCKVIEETTRDVLDILLFKRPVEVNTSVICKVCCTKVFEAFEFKAICTDTEDSLFPYVNSGNGATVNLKEVYLKEKWKEILRSVSEGKRICRLCMQIATSGFSSVRDLEKDLISKYIPELNFNWTEEPILCIICVESLKKHGGFLRNFFDTQKFKNIFDYGVMEVEFHIKTENIEIKSEGANKDNETVFPANESTASESQGGNGLNAQSFNNCITEREERHVTHELKHKHISDLHIYKRDEHNFETEHEIYPVNHELKHKNVSDMPMYKSDESSCKSKFKGSLVKHNRNHKGVSGKQIYQCDKCSYKFKYKGPFAKHQLIHKDSSPGHMYKCHKCSYESNHKGNLVFHQLVHKDASEVKMFKCESCKFKTKRKGDLVKYQINHKDPSEVQMFKCEMCSYESKYKSNFASHQLIHKDISEVTVYKCDVCNYESKRKGCVLMHRKRHKYSFQVPE